MTARKRFAQTMRYGAPDRVPYFDEGLRDGVLEQWRQQGLSAEADLATMFRYDRREELPVQFGLRPEPKKRPVSRYALKTLRRRLDALDRGRVPDDWQQRVHQWKGRDHLLQVRCHSGLFLSMGVNDWPSLSEVLYLLSDRPSHVLQILDLYAELCVRLMPRVLQEAQPDFALFSEPIGGSNGPLLSPAMYERLVLRSYRPIIEVLHQAGVETIVFLTYGNARALLPRVLDAGFNCLWACEVESEAMDYQALRREFGRSLRLIGGIDLDALLSGKAAIRREIETKVPPLLEQGGYIPLADGRVRQNVPFDNYRYYRELLQKVTQA